MAARQDLPNPTAGRGIPSAGAEPRGELPTPAQQPWLPMERAPPGQPPSPCAFIRPTGRTSWHQEESPSSVSLVLWAAAHWEVWGMPFPPTSPPHSLLSHYLLGDAFAAASITTASERTTGRQKAPNSIIFFLTLSLCFCISIIFLTRGCEAMGAGAAGSGRGRELLSQAQASF